MMLEVFAAAKLPLPAAYDSGEAEDLKAKVATVKAIELNEIQKVKSLIVAAKKNRNSLVITDYPEKCTLETSKAQLWYTLEDDRRHQWQTTYCYVEGDDPRKVLAQFMHLRESHPKLMADLVFALYSQRLDFRGSTKGVIAWFHDHLDLQRIVRRFIFRYRVRQKVYQYPSLPGRVVVPRAIMPSFRRFSNIPIHKLSGPSHYTLVVGKEFWEDSNWEEGASRTYLRKNLCDTIAYAHPESRYHNFLQHFARLKPVVGSSLSIEGSSGDARKQALTDGLRREIYLAQSDRTDVVEERSCVCDEVAVGKNTVETCCLWDLPRRERHHEVRPKQDKERQKDNMTEEQRRQEKLDFEAPSRKLRESNKNPDTEVGLKFLRGRHLGQFSGYLNLGRTVCLDSESEDSD